jgi:hypothetical protein
MKKYFASEREKQIAYKSKKTFTVDFSWKIKDCPKVIGDFFADAILIFADSNKLAFVGTFYPNGNDFMVEFFTDKITSWQFYCMMEFAKVFLKSWECKFTFKYHFLTKQEIKALLEEE